jgi:hypothetical protein
MDLCSHGCISNDGVAAWVKGPVIPVVMSEHAGRMLLYHYPVHCSIKVGRVECLVLSRVHVFVYVHSVAQN